MAVSILEALEVLNGLIRAGWEFPDAAWKVAQAYGVNQSALELAYDNQP